MTSQAFSDSDLSGTRVYEIYHSYFRHHYNVLANGKQFLHVDVSWYTRGKPDLTFHAGADTNAPVVSVCKLPRWFSQDLMIGFGDPRAPNDVVWESLTSLGITRRKYRIEMTIGNGKSGDRRSFLWHFSTFGDDLELVDEKTQAVVAKFNSSAYSLKKSGRLEIYKTYGSDFDLKVLSTALALDDKRARNSGGDGSV